jgi:hypothetical protein
MIVKYHLIEPIMPFMIIVKATFHHILRPSNDKERISRKASQLIAHEKNDL